MVNERQQGSRNGDGQEARRCRLDTGVIVHEVRCQQQDGSRRRAWCIVGVIGVIRLVIRLITRIS